MEGTLTEGVSLRRLLRFVTGLSSIPPLGLNKPVKIDFLPPDEGQPYPKAVVCYFTLSLPIIHPTFSAFKTAFITALQYGDGYGQL